jgi:hypothetical protein
MWIDKRTTNAFSKLPFVLGLSKDLIFRSPSFRKGEALRDEHATAGTRTLHL